jgi:PAS domain S-box-containing protein
MGRLLAGEASGDTDSLLHSILDQSPYPMWIADSQGTLIWLNQSCRDLLQLSGEEVIGKYNVFRDNIVEEQGLQPLLRRVLEQGERVRFEITYDTALLKTLPLTTPTLVILDVTVSPILDDRGQVTHAIFQHVDITERKRAETALAESEQRFKTFMDHLPAAVFIKDRADRLLFANRHLREIFGWDDCLGKSTAELVPPEHAARMVADDQRALATGSLVSQEKVTDVQGRERFFDTYKFPVVSDGAPVLLGGIAVDVTARKRAEDAVQQSERRFRALIENSADAIVLFGEDGATLYGSPSSTRVLGYDLPEFRRRNAFSLVHPEDLPAFTALFADILQHPGGTRSITARVMHQDGSWRYLEANLTNLLADPSVEAIVNNYRDVTERKLAEEALELSEKKYRSFYRSILDGFGRVDMTGKIVETNQGFLDMLGYTQEEIQELRYQDITPVKWHEFEAEIIEEQVLTRGYSDTYEKEYIRKDGIIFPVELRTYLVEDESGAPQGMWAFIRDITDRKQNEEALKKEKLFTEAIVDSLPGTFFLLDSQGRQLRTNKSGLAASGYSIEELTQLHALDSLAQEDREAGQRALEEVLTKGEASMEAQMLTKDGRKIPYLFTARKFLIDDVPHILGTGLDITALKESEEALQESEERFRHLAAAAFEAIIIHEKGIIVSANDQFYEMFGYEPEELLGKEALPLTVAPEAIESMRKKIAAGSLEPYESIGLKKDGTKFPMEIRAREMEYRGRKARVAAIRDITERRRAEEALRESEERYRSLFQNNHAVMLLINPETGAIVDTNPAARNFYGYSHEELLTKTTADLNTLPPDQIFRAMQKAKAERQKHFQFQHRLASGEVRDVEVFSGPIRIKGQDLLYSIIHDVTARKKAQEALRESEKRLKEAQELAHLGFWYWNVKTGEVTWSDEVYKIFQLDPQEFTPTIDSILELSPWPGDRERDQELLRKAMESHEQGAYEQRFIRPDKSIGYYYSTFQGKYDAEGHLLTIVGTVLDITERKKAEEALRESETKYRHLYQDFQGILDTIPDTVCLLSPDLTIMWANQVPAIRPELPNISEIGKHCYPQRHGRSEPCDDCPVLRCFQSGKMETDIHGAHGKVWELRAFPIYDDQGELRGGLEVARDITESKRMEEALEKRLVALSRPLDDAGEIDFQDLFNLKDIQRIQDLFAQSTGVASLITAPDGTPITQPSNFCRLCSSFIRQTEKGRQKCAASDARLGRYNPTGPTVHHCLSAGLCGAGASITVGGKHIATWLIGQVRDETVTEEEVRDYARDLGLDPEEFLAAFLEVPPMPEEHFKQVAQALFVLANQLSAMAYQNVQQARFITERKQAEERLLATQERLELALQGADLGTWDWNVETGAILVNQRWTEMLGYTLAEIEPHVRFWEGLVHPDDLPGVMKNLNAHLAGQTPYYETEHRLRHKSGDWVWVLDKGKVIERDSQGKAVRACGTHLDITERKRAEAALRESEARFRQVVESSPLPMGISNDSGEIEYLNPKFQETFGYTLGDMPRLEDWFRLAYPDPAYRQLLLAKWQQAWEKIREEGLTTVREAEITCKDNSKRIMQIFGTQMENKSLVVFNDLTDRKRAEIALRNSERRLSEIIDFLPDATFAVDLEGKVIAWNRAIEEMTLVPAEDIVGKGNYEYTLPFYGIRRPALIDLVLMPDAEIEKKYAFVQKEGDILLAEAEVHLHGGTQVVWAKARPLYDSQGNVVGAIEAIRDITERKQAEEERLKLEAQMREVQKLESLGVLAGGIAHDFNNLLMAILGNADLALLTLSPASPARPHVEEITRGSLRAADLCRQMLAYSGKGRFVIGRYNLSEIVQEMTQMLKVSVSKKATLRYSLGEDLPAVEVDATQMRQVVMNLIINASESLGDQNGFISVATGVVECDRAYLSESYLDDNLAEGRYVFLEVADTGCGMDDETRRRIFDPFFTTKFTGRGLGLAAVLGIVRGHQGTIKVYSEPGQGTTFKVLFPAVDWAPAEQGVGASTGSRQLQGGTILLVDDDAHVRQVVMEMLERLGFAVLLAINGREGLEVFKAHGEKITCVILDLTMPEMAGDEMFRELRRLRKDVPVILSSGFNEQEVTQRFAGKGVAGFIQKPYTVRTLQEALSRVLGPA